MVESHVKSSRVYIIWVEPERLTGRPAFPRDCFNVCSQGATSRPDPHEIFVRLSTPNRAKADESPTKSGPNDRFDRFAHAPNSVRPSGTVAEQDCPRTPHTARMAVRFQWKHHPGD